MAAGIAVDIPFEQGRTRNIHMRKRRKKEKKAQRRTHDSKSDAISSLRPAGRRPSSSADKRSQTAYTISISTQYMFTQYVSKSAGGNFSSNQDALAASHRRIMPAALP